MRLMRKKNLRGVGRSPRHRNPKTGETLIKQGVGCSPRLKNTLENFFAIFFKKGLRTSGGCGKLASVFQGRLGL